MVYGFGDTPTEPASTIKSVHCSVPLNFGNPRHLMLPFQAHVGNTQNTQWPSYSCDRVFETRAENCSLSTNDRACFPPCLGALYLVQRCGQELKIHIEILHNTRIFYHSVENKALDLLDDEHAFSSCTHHDYCGSRRWRD